MSKQGRAARKTPPDVAGVAAGRGEAHHDANARRLRARGFEVQARRLERFVSLRTLGLPCATLLAGRLAPALGGERPGAALVLRAVRRDPASLDARLAAAKVLLAHQGPIVAWMRMRVWDARPCTTAPAEVRAAWLAQHARVAANFRDFAAARELLASAESLAPGLAPTGLARADVLLQQDHREEALDAALAVLSRQPAHRHAAQLVAHLLLTLGRADEAIEELREAALRTEDCRVLQQLAWYLAEERRFAECLEWLDRFEAGAPLLDRPGVAWLRAVRSGARREQGSPISRREREGPGEASAGEGARRVLLPVPFVPQDRFTCSPATLTSLAAFWSQPIDHDALAEEICYDGTPRHRVRSWASDHGFVVREFRVTWDSARALLDRGVPFALVTRDTMSGHDQAVAGYDESLRCLLVRCPSRPFLVHMPIDWLARAQAWCGPRGTIVLPEGEVARLDGLDLPDTEAYDDFHALQLALALHHRDEAGEVVARMRRCRRGSFLILWASLELALYDSDDAAALEWVEALRERFPNTPALELIRLRTQGRLVSPSAYGRMLAATCDRYHDDALRSLHALQLSSEPATAREARRVLRPLLRRGHWPIGGFVLAALANVRSSEGREEEAEALVALAARLEDMQEWIAMAYFDQARRRGRSERALAYLRERWAAYCRISSRPSETLFEALRVSQSAQEAHRVLEEALSLRPDDHDLKLFAADACAARGDHDRADALLAAARGRTHRARWLRTAAGVARSRGFERVSLELWREVLAVEPTAVDAHRAVADLLTQMGQASAANAHLRSISSRYPRHYFLAQLAARA